MMESVEDIPATSILDGLPWDWITYGEYLDGVDRLPKGINVGGMVGHCAVRYHVDGRAQPRRGARRRPTTSRRCARSSTRPWCRRARASRPRARCSTVCPTVDPCRARGPSPRSCSRSPTCSAGTGAGVRGCGRLGERRRRLAHRTPRPRSRWMASCQPPHRAAGHLRAGPVRSPARPLRTRDRVHRGGQPTAARVRPQTTARGIGIAVRARQQHALGRAPSWSALRRPAARRAPRGAARSRRRAALIDEADGTRVRRDGVFVLAGRRRSLRLHHRRLARRARGSPRGQRR